MALKALRDADGDETVTPEEVGRGEDVYCIDCGERLRVWRSHTREDGTVVIRHFKAPGGGSGNTDHNGCGGGEGEIHKRAKNIAVGTLREFYPEATVSSETTFSILGALGPGTKVGDVVVEFSTPHTKFGSGIAVEVQDKHRDKDVLGTTRSYLKNDFSVCWLSADEFGKHSLKYGKEEFERLLHGNHPDVDSVFCAALNSDGTVPRKEMYPLVASVWPDGVEVLREIHPRVDSGWFYSAYQSDGFGRTKLQAESEIALTEMNPMPEREVQLPKEWYEERARQYYRETAWEDLFETYVWDTGEVRREWGDLAKLDEFEVRMPLEKWLAEDELALVVGEIVPKSDNVIIPGHDITPRNTTRVAKMGDSKLAALVPESYVRGIEPDTDDTMLISDGDVKYSIRELECYIPQEAIWERTPWADRFPGSLELPIIADTDDEPTTPKGEIPIGRWIASDGPTPEIENSLKRAFENGRENIPESHKEKMEAKERIPRIVDYNTGGPQPETIEDYTILTIASHANIAPNAVRWAIERLVSNDTLEKTQDGRYKLTRPKKIDADKRGGANGD